MPRPRPGSRRRAAAVQLATAVLAAAACGPDDAATAPEITPPLPCGAQVARIAGARIPFTGRILAGTAPRLEWTSDGASLLVLAFPAGDPCVTNAPAVGIPTVFAVAAATGGARALLPVTGATSDATVGADGRSALYVTPVRRDSAGQDVYGLVRVRVDGAADTLLREVPPPRFDAVDAAGRVVAHIAPGLRRGAREVVPDTLVAVDVATRVRRPVRVLDGVGYRVMSLAPDGAHVLLHSGLENGGVVIRMADGALLGAFSLGAGGPIHPGVFTAFMVAARWRSGGAVDVLVEEDSSGAVTGAAVDTWKLFETFRFPERALARVGRVRGIAAPYDWMPDGAVVAWELAPPDSAVAPLVPGGSPPTAATLRLLAPGAAPRTLASGRFRTPPAAVRAAPDGRSVAFATYELVGVVPVR